MARSAQGAMVFHNGVGVSNLIISSTGLLVSDAESGRRAADDFTFDSVTHVHGIHFLGRYFSANTPQTTDSFSLVFYHDDGNGRPDTSSVFATVPIVDATRTNTGKFGIFEYSADFSSVLFPGETRFWLSVFNDTTLDTDDSWGWIGNKLTPSIFGDNVQFSVDSGDSWGEFGQPNSHLAFELLGQTLAPEPGSTCLTLVLALWLTHRRSRSTHGAHN